MKHYVNLQRIPGCYSRTSVLIVTLCVTTFFISGFISDAAASACCGAKPGAGPRVGTFSGALARPGDFLSNPHTDSIESFGLLYGYYGNSWSFDGHAGDPLGTGGKLPLVYALELYRVQGIDNQVLTKGDLREQYVDFGYLPTWRATTVAGIGKFRLTPQLSADAQLVYGGDPGKPGTNSSGQIGVGEISLTWAPVNLKHFWIKAGNILDGGTYTPVFDQSPIENFLYTGVVAFWGADAGHDLRSVTSLSFGGTFLNSTLLKDESFDMPGASTGFFRTSRQRTFLYAKTSLLIKNRVGLKLVGGIQAVPDDSIPKPGDPSRYFSLFGGIGGMGGIEATIFANRQYHTFAFSAARGEASVGTSSPDYTLINFNSEGAAVLHPGHNEYQQKKFDWSFTRAGSTVANIIYWNSIERGPLRLSAGAWYTARLPAKKEMTFVNPMSDSLRRLQPDPLMHDSLITIAAQSFHAVKFTLYPAVRIGTTPLYFGLRYDNISYLTPQAHTNAIEPQRDQTLRALPGDDDPQNPVYAPSKWDREAVGANILSPTLRLDFGEHGGISASYGCAFYDKPIDRQGKISAFHQNFTLGADVIITYRKNKKLFP